MKNIDEKLQQTAEQLIAGKKEHGDVSHGVTVEHLITIGRRKYKQVIKSATHEEALDAAEYEMAEAANPDDPVWDGYDKEPPEDDDGSSEK